MSILDDTYFGSDYNYCILPVTSTRKASNNIPFCLLVALLESWYLSLKLQLTVWS